MRSQFLSLINEKSKKKTSRSWDLKVIFVGEDYIGKPYFY